MLLAIDSGNTNATFGLFDKAGSLQHSWRLSTNAARTDDEYAAWLFTILQASDLTLTDITDVIIANVVPATDFAFRRLTKKYLKCDPLVIGDADVNLGIKIMTENPREAGADRIVNVIGGYKRINQTGMVIDFGTATTFDVMDKDGNYRGGISAPGINLSLKALVAGAAQLSSIPVQRPAKVIGENTRQAMQSGIFWGYVSLIEGLILRVAAELPQTPKVLATGGLAPLFSTAIEGIDEVFENLTLEGLWEIYKRNRT